MAKPNVRRRWAGWVYGRYLPKSITAWIEIVLLIFFPQTGRSRLRLRRQDVSNLRNVVIV